MVGATASREFRRKGVGERTAGEAARQGSKGETETINGYEAKKGREKQKN
jgi:hypothetical protein